MRIIAIVIASSSALVSLPASSQTSELRNVSDRFVMPQSRARQIASALNNWTLNSGEKPRAVSIARDCLSANGYIMQRGSGQYGINQSAMPGMAFWSSINGAAIMMATNNGQREVPTQDKTSYQQKFGTDEYDAPMDEGRLPQFITDKYAECERIRKRWGG